MKNILSLFIILVCFSANAQVAGSLAIYDTRAVNEVPNAYNHSIRADFKLRSTIGVPGQGFYSTTLSLSQWDSTNNSGDKNHQLNFNNGGIFYRNAFPLESQWGNWQQIIMTDINGNVGIGTTNPTSKLTVAGNIISREVKVTVDAGADFVFEKEYNLPSLESVDQFIRENKHLPEVASAEEMKKDGINLSEMNIKLLQKIEELTLYVIEMKKENLEMKKRMQKLEKR